MTVLGDELLQPVLATARHDDGGARFGEARRHTMADAAGGADDERFVGGKWHCCGFDGFEEVR